VAIRYRKSHTPKSTTKHMAEERVNGNPITALAIPPERIKNESDLRSEINGLEATRKKLKDATDSIFHAFASCSEDFAKMIATIRKHEREILESYFPNMEKEMLAWLKEAPKLDMKIPRAKLSPDENTRLKKLYRTIAKAMHPDHDLSERYANLFKEAALAYQRGDLMAIEQIAEELETGHPVYSRNLRSTLEELTERRDLLKSLISELEKSIEKMDLAGVEAKIYLGQDLRFNHRAFKDAVENELRSKVQSYCEPDEGHEATSPAKGIRPSKETTLIPSQPIHAISVISDEEKERILKLRIGCVVERLDMICPYYKGQFGFPRNIWLQSDESTVANHVQAGVNTVLEWNRDYGENDWQLPLDDSRIVQFRSGGRHCTFLSYPDGHIAIPKIVLRDSYSNSLSVLDLLEKLLEQPLRVLHTYDTIRGNRLIILGDYEEHTSRHISPEYRLDSVSEVILERLLRAMCLLKIPILIEHKFEKKQYVWVEDLQNSFLYTGKQKKKDGEEVELKVRVDGRLRTVRGSIVEMEDEEPFDDPYDKLSRCHEVTWEGTLTMDGQQMPFSMLYKKEFGSGFLWHSDEATLKRSWDFEIDLAVNNKPIHIEYKRQGNSLDPKLTINGIGEELLPDLLFKTVERLRITKVQGIYIDRNCRKQTIDYL